MHKVLEQMNIDVYYILRKALELGKWETGERLSNKQKQSTMQLILLFEHASNLPETERVGYVESTCSNSADDSSEEATIILKS